MGGGVTFFVDTVYIVGLTLVRLSLVTNKGYLLTYLGLLCTRCEI